MAGAAPNAEGAGAPKGVVGAAPKGAGAGAPKGEVAGAPNIFERSFC